MGLLNGPVVPFRHSRGCCHRDWTGYMPVPSAWNAITRRSGHATAAPVAHGSPCPIAPPVNARYVCAGALADALKNGSPVVAAYSITIECSGIVQAIAAPAVIASSLPEGRSDRAALGGKDTATGAPSSVARASSAAGTSSVGSARFAREAPSGTRELGRFG